MKKLILLLVFSLSSHAAEINSKVYSTDDKHQLLGTVSFKDTKYGMQINPKLEHLPPGTHGFHIHQQPNCGDHAMEAGGHFDPLHKDSHLGPYNEGHLGDLPVLYVNDQGKAYISVLAPRLKVGDIIDKSIMIHAGDDNYSNSPPLGGGGERIACGVIKIRKGS